MTQPDLEKLKQDIVFHHTLRNFRLEFRSTWGLFCPRNIDEGTELLLRHIEVSETDTVLDLGCGYGAIGVTLGKLCPAGRVHMVDKDFIAVEYAKKNVEINGLSNCEVYLSNAFSDVPKIPFDVIASNIPAKVGKELLTIILLEARARLRPGGKLYVVTINGLRKFIKRNFEEIFGNYDKIKQGAHYTVALAVKE